MLDRNSEAIAHFIGHFDREIDALLTRLDYDKFSAQQKAEYEPGDLLNVKVNVSSPLSLTDMYPQVDMPIWFSSAPLSPMGVGIPHSEGFRAFGADTSNQLYSSMSAWEYFGQGKMLFILPPENSWAAIVAQKNTLLDDDTLLLRPLDLPEGIARDASPEALDALLVNLARAADALDRYASNPTEEPPVEALSGAHISRVTGDDDAFDTVADGGVLVLDGASLVSTPETLTDALDARLERLTDEEVLDEEPEVNEGRAVSGESVTEHVEISSAAPATSVPQEISTGDNLLMNEAVWGGIAPDAGTFIVGGEYTSTVKISQINVESNTDLVMSDVAGQAEVAPSMSGNFAEISYSSNAPTAVVGANGQVYTGAPAGYALATLDGDLVFTSQIVQINLISDNDVITYEQVFHSVDISLGENMSVNSAVLNGFQFGYDVIMVGGDMFQSASISQTNILLDNDFVVAENGTLGSVLTGANLLWNEATISISGIDTVSEMTGDASRALDSLNSGDFDPFRLDGLDGLNGTQVARVLAVEGDYVMSTTLTQINILSDSDLIQLFADDAAAFSQFDLRTGDNILANTAKVNVMGLDSDIMASGGAYSDVVIFQAGMYDTDAASLDLGDTDMSGLATEAVAFLVDGMIDGTPASDEATGADICGVEGCQSGNFDALNTMIS
ncbi:hypothetical protein [Celeribacter sp.]|uniref:hypothetical protein n=1 Tax=Celeribacter sp. TaxID=1890673 RepID=UPI003A92EC53